MMEHGFNVTTQFTADGKIVQEVCSVDFDVREQVTRHVLDTQDQQIREALIALGWTPPLTWGDVYYRWLRKGTDHGWAAYQADQWHKRKYGKYPKENNVEKTKIDKIVDRFLSWQLPKDFAPDGGITFTPSSNPHSWPIGTNLLTAAQAKMMIEHILADDA